MLLVVRTATFPKYSGTSFQWDYKIPSILIQKALFACFCAKERQSNSCTLALGILDAKLQRVTLPFHRTLTEYVDTS